MYVPSCGAETVTRYRLPDPVRPVTDPPAPSWATVSVQPFRVPASPDAPSLTRKAQSPAIPVPPKSGVYVRIMSSAPSPEYLCSVLAVPSGATSSTVRSSIYGCAMSTETETDVAARSPAP